MIHFPSLTDSWSERLLVVDTWPVERPLGAGSTGLGVAMEMSTLAVPPSPLPFWKEEEKRAGAAIILFYTSGCVGGGGCVGRLNVGVHLALPINPHLLCCRIHLKFGTKKKETKENVFLYMPVDRAFYCLRAYRVGNCWESGSVEVLYTIIMYTSVQLVYNSTVLLRSV